MLWAFFPITFPTREAVSLQSPCCIMNLTGTIPANEAKMAFELVYYSQQDPRWKADILGFGDKSDTIGYVGCALTSTAMLLSGHGFAETPKSLNQRLKSVKGFVGAGIRWGAVTQLYPKVVLKAFIPSMDSPAPLAQIDSALAAGQPAIVMVDSAPAPGIQTHWVVLYEKKDGDYLMLDPWPYLTDVTKENPLLKRYSQGKSLERCIKHVILYQNTAISGITTDTDTSGLPRARVKAEVVWGLNIRSSASTASTANVLEVVPALTELIILESGGAAKIGAINQWVQVHTPSGRDGFAAAWYLEAAPVVTPVPPATEPEPPTPLPVPPPPIPTPEHDDRLKVMVSASMGSQGLRVRAYESLKAKILSTQPSGAVLACVEPYDEALAKVGVKGKWLKVRYAVAKFGFVQAEYVETLG